jgi:rhodanese-related sulfurtransferase
LLDVRDDSAYLHISRDAKTNAYGTFKSAIHISLAEIEKKYPAVPKSKKVIIIDLYGQDAVTAAAFLKKKRYPDVSVLTEGIDRMLGDDQQALGCMGTEYISPVPYSIINTRSLKSFLETSKGYLFLDVRSAEEFTNRHRNSWQNIGHIANAVNIPADGLKDQWKSIEAYKNKRIIIYGFGTSPLAFKAAVDLSKLGFTELYVLHGGLFNIGWTAANVKGYSSLADLREEVPAENQ